MNRALYWGMLVLFTGCTGSDTTPAEDGTTAADTMEEHIATVDVVLLSEVVDPVGKDTGIDFGEPDIGLDVLQLGCQPGEGCFLDECASNAACQSGWCVEHLGDGVCTKNCQDECPAGWTCQQVAGTEPDVVFICVSDYANLCKPCGANGDCGTVGKQDVCLDYGKEGSFCGGVCEVDGDCPWGFSCETTVTVDGSELMQCVSDTGSCPCSGKSVSLGLATPCMIENEFGACPGHRICTEDGLADCDATVAAAEECNGLDDNCNGLFDEATCDDEFDCTADSCDPETGCVNEFLENGECADGNPCTVADHCVAGECTGSPVPCNDDNPCTDDSCDETGGCIFTANQNDCDDELPCTIGDHCKDSVCTGAAVECGCQSDADCVDLEDGDLCNGTLFCDTSSLPFECALVPESAIDCPEPNGPNVDCLAAACDPESGECSIVQSSDGLACNDGDLCTIGETCTLGECAGGDALNCNDGNVCTDDFCDTDDGCQYLPNDKGCQDGSICTVNDACADGECLPGQPLACDDNNACTDDSCASNIGCVFDPNDAGCNDANPCTTGDHCDEGKCIPALMLDCDDGNPCTDDSCEADKGCVHSLNQNPCDDGNACTEDDQCSSGWCSGQIVGCDDGNVCTDDSCDQALGCLNLANDKPCTDATVCTVGDHCEDGECVSTGELDCDDDNLCTDDACNADLGCVHKANDAPCDDGDNCTEADQCQESGCAGGAVVVCNDDVDCTADECVSPGGCQFAPNDLACDDDDLCTDDTCDPEFGCVHSLNQAPCDDGNPCTDGDACAAGICEGGELAQCDDGNICTTGECQGDQGCVYTPAAGDCDDGNPCTNNDSCQLGECTGAPLPCDDDVACTMDECTAESGCTSMPDDAFCDDGNVCTTNSCDPNSGCTSTPAAGACDGGQCVDGECVLDCVPDCDGKECGDNGCEGSCGSCDDGFNCSAGSCIEAGNNECNDGNDIHWDGCTNGEITEYRTNTFTPGDQSFPDVAGLTNKRHVVVWASYDQDGSKWGIFGQLYDTDGGTLGDEFQVNTYTANEQELPRVASLGNGKFIVAWQSISQDGSGWGVYGRRFSADASPTSGELQLNSVTNSHQYLVAIAGQADDSFLPTWYGYPDGSGWGVFYRLFKADNSPQFGDKVVNSYVGGTQYQQDVAAHPGGYVAAWQSNDQDTSGYGVYGQRFDLSGTKLGNEFKVHTYTVSGQERPAIGAYASGGFVTVWESYNEDGSGWGIYGQRFAANGSKINNPFRVNTYIVSSQYTPDVATWSDGRFVVVWNSSGQDGDSEGIFGQRYNSDGTPAGNEFQVNVYTKYSQRYPAVATIPGAGFVVTWNSQAQDDSVSGVFAQRYDAAGNKLYH